MKTFDEALGRMSVIYNDTGNGDPPSENFLRDYGRKFAIKSKRETELLANKFKVIAKRDRSNYSQL
jgi:hypothetical protein